LLDENHRRRGAAEAEYRQVMTIRQKLADDFPEQPDYLWKLASSLNNLGRFLADVGKLPDAEGEYRQAAGMQEKLAARFPGAPSYRQDLARTYGNFGNLRVIQGKPAEAEAHYRQAVALQEKLAAEFPAAQGYSIDLAGGLCNLGNLIRDGGKPKESLESLNKAIDILAPIIEKQPELDDARIFLRNAHWGRAQTLDQLGRHPHAMTDWDRAVALSADPERGSARAGRAGSRIQAGQVAEAVAEIDELTKASGWSASQWYDFACVYALASAKSATAKEQFGKRAVELLRLAVEHGFANAAQFEKDSDLDSLRSRPDFQQLIKEIRAKATTPRSKKP